MTITQSDTRLRVATESISSFDDVVDVDTVSKSFLVDGHEVPVLNNVTLRVKKGEVISIVGPSGCGKTTLLRMVQGLETISSGSLSVSGKSVASSSVDAGFVFQQPSLFPWFSVRRNIEFGLRLRARSKETTKEQRDARVNELLELVGLSEFANYRPHQLSGGMQQRVNLARALAIDPAVLLLDEPFSALDMFKREQLQVVLGQLLAELGTTAILVTHDIREAVFLGTRAVVMGGKPGGVLAEFAIDQPRPRDEEFQHGPEIGEIAHDVYAELHKAASEIEKN